MDKTNRDIMRPDTQPYLQVESIGVIIRLSGIEIGRNIRSEVQEVRVGDIWVRVYATEPRVSGGDKPNRVLELYGDGWVVDQLLLLEANLRNSGVYIEMKDASGEVFYVYFKRLGFILFVSGIFLVEASDDEFQCCFKIPENNDIIGMAVESMWNRVEIAKGIEWGYIRALHIKNLSLYDQQTLTRAIIERTNVLAEKYLGSEKA